MQDRSLQDCATMNNECLQNLLANVGQLHVQSLLTNLKGCALSSFRYWGSEQQRCAGTHREQPLTTRMIRLQWTITTLERSRGGRFLPLSAPNRCAAACSSCLCGVTPGCVCQCPLIGKSMTGLSCACVLAF